MFIDKMLGGMFGIGGGEQQAQGAESPKKGNSFEQIGDSFKNGDIMGGIGGILGMATGMSGMGGMGGGGGNTTETMGSMMFMDPLTKMVFEEIGKLGYSQEGQSNKYGPPTTGGQPAGVGGGQPVTSGCSAYEAQWAGAVKEVKDHFDLLDTAAGVNGKDGLIGRCDLEAAAKNPGLPAELRNACQFLLANPAAFNQLDVGAGIGKCDGLIGKCDVDAVLAALPKKAEPAKPNTVKLEETQPKESAPGENGLRAEGTSSTDETGEIEEASGSGEANGSKEISNPYEGLNLEEILWEVMNDINGDLNDLANKLKTTAKDSEDFAKIQQDIEKLMQRRKEMYTLISNMNAAEHDMAMTAISHIR